MLMTTLSFFDPVKYPVIRGSALLTSDRSAYLWTSGYAARLDTYMGPETPTPLLIKVVRGDCSLKHRSSGHSWFDEDQLQLLSSQRPTSGHYPIANAVGDVLIAAPINSEPRLPFKFYI